MAYDDVIAEQTADDDAELLVEEDDTIEVRVDVAIVCVVVVIVTVGAMQAAERSELQSVLTTVVNASVLDPSGMLSVHISMYVNDVKYGAVSRVAIGVQVWPQQVEMKDTHIVEQTELVVAA